MKGKSETQGTKWVFLLNSAETMDDMRADVQKGLEPITALHPCSHGWDTSPNFSKHLLATNAIKNIGEIEQKGQSIVQLDGGILLHTGHSMDDGLTSY